MFSLGFSVIFKIFQLKSVLNIQYFSGVSTFFTSTQYQFDFNNFSKSFFSNILSQFIIKTSNHESIHTIAAHVHFFSGSCLW
jgi:replication initiation and membrane attachment protein DnaB